MLSNSCTLHVRNWWTEVLVSHPHTKFTAGASVTLRAVTHVGAQVILAGPTVLTGIWQAIVHFWNIQVSVSLDSEFLHTRELLLIRGLYPSGSAFHRSPEHTRTGRIPSGCDRFRHWDKAVPDTHWYLWQKRACFPTRRSICVESMSHSSSICFTFHTLWCQRGCYIVHNSAVRPPTKF